MGEMGLGEKGPGWREGRVVVENVGNGNGRIGADSEGGWNGECGCHWGGRGEVGFVIGHVEVDGIVVVFGRVGGVLLLKRSGGRWGGGIGFEVLGAFPARSRKSASNRARNGSRTSWNVGACAVQMCGRKSRVNCCRAGSQGRP
jgi:hypothetical protein